MYFIVLIYSCIRRWFYPLRGLLMQYRDCHLILTNDPLHMNCILRLPCRTMRRERRSLDRVRTFILAANISQGRGNRCAISSRCNVHRRILSGRRITRNVCRKPHTDLTTAGARATSQRHESPRLTFAVNTNSRDGRLSGILGQGLSTFAAVDRP